MSSTTANSAAAPIAMIFGFSDNFVLQALEGLTHEELWRPLTPSNNPLLWVAGHIVQTRATVLQMLGEKADSGWGPLFDRGAKLGDPTDYPSGSEVARVMGEISPRLHAALAALQDEQLNRPASLPIPGLKTLTDELAFFALHDAYHVGQLAYVRKGLGYPGLAG
ncbi:MAG TPA: DinB family protein [Terracidiphilus sp.]|nr:DinB family protein [Terracidiphilus sp.]